MIIVEDTRNQIGKHQQLNNQIKALGIPVVRTKLFVGDYSRLDNMTICIDTKKDWAELAGNICGKQHERFRNECLRAKTAQIKLIILIEEDTPISEWVAPKKRDGKPICRVSNLVLEKAMKTMEEKYEVEFLNCSKYKTAEKIIKILGGKND